MPIDRKKIIIFVVVIIIGIALLAVLYGIKNSKDMQSTPINNPTPVVENPSSGSNDEPLTITAEEKKQIQNLAVTFVGLYNSYEYDDYSNLYAEGDYQTLEMQNKTVAYIKQLDDTVQYGFKKRTEANPESFSYNITGIDTIEVGINGVTREYQDDVINDSYRIKSSLILKKNGDFWLVDSIIITKQ